MKMHPSCHPVLDTPHQVRGRLRSMWGSEYPTKTALLQLDPVSSMG